MKATKILPSGLWIWAGAVAFGLATSILIAVPGEADSGRAGGVNSGPIVSAYLQVPSNAQPSDTPSALNVVRFLRTYDKDANGRADAIILFQDGATAGPWGVLAKQIVDMAAQRGKWVEVWMVDRRENGLEDHRGFSLAIHKGDPRVALDYYYGESAIGADGKFNLVAPLGGPGAAYVALKQDDVPFMANWGVDVIFGDMETLLDLIPAQYRETNVFLMGNFQGAYLLQAFAGQRLSDGNRGYQELAGLIMVEGTPNLPTAVEPSAGDVATYLASVDALRDGTLPRYQGSPSPQVLRDLISIYTDLFPHRETIFPVPPGTAGGPLADQFVADLRLTNLARSGFGSDDDPIPGAFLQSFFLAFLSLRAGTLDFTPVPGTEGTCAVPGPLGNMPPCVPPISQIDPNKVYDWLDGGPGNPGAAGNPLCGWTTPVPGVFTVPPATNAYVIPGEKPTQLSGATLRDTYDNATQTNVPPVKIDFPDSGPVKIDPFPSDSYAWYVNNRFQAIDMNFIGKYQKVMIQSDGVDIDIDKTAVSGIPLISYVPGYQTTPPLDPFPGVTDFTAVYRGGAIQTPQAAAVGVFNPLVSTQLYKNGDFYYADNSLAGQVTPGENGANVVSASLMDWLIPRMGSSEFKVPSFSHAMHD
jgi:hypothetical protein